jgi:hypothetical protein
MLASQSIGDRMKGAALLDIDTYEAVEADQNATGQAAAVVLLVAVCQAVAEASAGPVAALTAAAVSFVAWIVWAGVTFLVGDKLFGGTASWGELLRTTGFAQSAGVLYLLGVLPLVGYWVGFATSVWILIAGFIAIRQALDIGNFKTFLTVIVGGLIYAVLQNLPLTPL